MRQYITIEREYGAGGTEIARLISEKTGVPCYGREILELVSKEHNISIEDIERYEESAKSSLFYSIFVVQQAYGAKTDMLDKEGHIFIAEQNIIERLANTHTKAVFIGHCASQALADRDGVLKVFIRCSDEEKKKKRIINVYHIDPSRAEAERRFYDRKRANYYSINTGHSWKEPENYDIIIDDASLSLEECADMLSGYFH
jgi:cytidylate kinase